VQLLVQSARQVHGEPGWFQASGELPSPAVGEMRLAPEAERFYREGLPWLERTWRLRRVDDLPVWAISCFYVRIGYRRKGVTRALIEASIAVARKAGAPALEAYPFDGALSPSASGTGYLSTFLRAGFREVARRDPPRPIVRYKLGTTGRKGVAR